jgi:hypothetical protein
MLSSGTSQAGVLVLLPPIPASGFVLQGSLCTTLAGVVPGASLAKDCTAFLGPMGLLQKLHMLRSNSVANVVDRFALLCAFPLASLNLGWMVLQRALKRFFYQAVKAVAVFRLSSKFAAGCWIAVMPLSVGDAALTVVAELGAAGKAVEGVAGGQALFPDGVQQRGVVSHRLKGRRWALAPGCTQGHVFQPGMARGGQPAVALGWALARDAPK